MRRVDRAVEWRRWQRRHIEREGHEWDVELAEKRRRELSRIEREGMIERYSRLTFYVVVAIICVLLVSPVYANPNLNAAQSYADEVGHKMGIVAVVVEHEFGNRDQRGESRIYLKAGKKLNVILIGRRYLETGRTTEIRNTVRHELCHFQAYQQLGTPMEGARYHGRTWRRCAAEWDVDVSNIVLN